jgi:hypothetical protein
LSNVATMITRRRPRESPVNVMKQGRPPAARTRTLSGSRFLQPKPSRFLTEKVAVPLRQVSRFSSGMAVRTLELAQRRIAVSIAALDGRALTNRFRRASLGDWGSGVQISALRP